MLTPESIDSATICTQKWVTYIFNKIFPSFYPCPSVAEEKRYSKRLCEFPTTSETLCHGKKDALTWEKNNLGDLRVIRHHHGNWPEKGFQVVRQLYSAHVCGVHRDEVTTSFVQLNFFALEDEFSMKCWHDETYNSYCWQLDIVDIFGII